MKERTDGTLILDREDLRLLAERSEYLVDLLRDVPGDQPLSWDALDALCAEAVRQHPRRHTP
jgi:hypothetical protein